MPETKLEIGLRKLRDYGGGSVLSDAEVNAVLDEYDATKDREMKLREALEKIAEHGVSSHAWAWNNKVARAALDSTGRAER